MDAQSEAVCACSGKKRTLLYVTLFFGAVSSIVSLVYIYKYEPSRATTASSATHLYLSAGVFEASTLYSIENGALSPLRISVNGKQENVLDAQKVSDGSVLYVLVDSPEHFVTNLYRVRASGSLEKITDTATTKYNLSVNPLATKAVFQEDPITSIKQLSEKTQWTISEIDLSSKRTRSVTTGSKPRYVNTTSFFVVKGAAVFGFSSEPQKNATGTKELSLSAASAYTQNAAGTRLAFYNRTTAHNDVFAITPNAGISYLSSLPARIPPAVLTFIGDDVVGISGSSLAKDHGTMTLINYSKSETAVETIQNPEGRIPQRLISYE